MCASANLFSLHWALSAV